MAARTRRVATQLLEEWTTPKRRLAAWLALVLALAVGWDRWSRGGAAAAEPPALLRVDPNTAPAAVLRALPRLGPVLVDRIVEERTQRPFSNVAEIDLRVRGVGPATVLAIEPFLRFDEAVESDSPVVIEGR